MPRARFQNFRVSWTLAAECTLPLRLTIPERYRNQNFNRHWWNVVNRDAETVQSRSSMDLPPSRVER